MYLTEEGKKVHKSHIKYDTETMEECAENMELADEQIRIANIVIQSCLEYFKKRLHKEIFFFFWNVIPLEE